MTQTGHGEPACSNASRRERIFTGMCRQAGVNLAITVEEAFEAAATFATQPLPRGPNVAVLTTAGGWGVLVADALARSLGAAAREAASLRTGADRTLVAMSGGVSAAPRLNPMV